MAPEEYAKNRARELFLALDNADKVGYFQESPDRPRVLNITLVEYEIRETKIALDRLNVHLMYLKRMNA